MGRITGKNGGVTFLSSHNADFSAWSLTASQPVDDDTSYADTGSGASSSGSGSIDYSLDVSGFLKDGTSFAPGLDDITAAGATATFTAHTGCTESLTVIVTSATIDHRKRAGAIPIRFSARGDGNLTETWSA
jgi:hypothetical protein